jgi:hypothetical protein
VRKEITGWGDARPWVRFALVAYVAFVGAADTSFARSRHQDGESSKSAEEAAPPSGPLFFVISTNKQHVSVYGKNGLYEVSPVSTGRPDHPTPHGIFSIIGKERFHRSNLYSGAPMPFMQRITWSGVAMHEGVLPGYAASHGCVRLPHEFAKRLFGYTEGNERVIISRQDIAPAAISHPGLFVPKLMEAPGASIASGSGQMLQNAIALTERSRLTGDAKKLDVAVKPETSDTIEAAPGQKLLNPIEFAKAMKARAAKQADEAAAALSPARNAIEAKAKEAREAAFNVRKAEIALASAKDVVETADRRIKRAAADEEAAKVAVEAKAQAAAKLADAEAALSAAQRVKAEKDQDVAQGPAPAVIEAKQKEVREAASAVRKAEYALSEAKDQLETADRRVRRAARDEEASKLAAAGKAQAEAKVGEAETALSAAQRVKTEKEQEAAPLLTAMEAKAKDAREAALAVRKAEIALSNAKDSLESADRRAKRTTVDPEASKLAADARAQAMPKVADAEAALSAAQRAKAEKDRDATGAMKAFKDADSARRAAADAAKAWERRLAPLSVFISRKTQRLYIRQGHIKVFDVPVTIREPEKPLGTHVYMAMPQQGAQGSQPSVHWLVMTIPDASTETEEPRRHRRRHSDEEEAPVKAQPIASASEALDRIEVAPEVREKISEMLWTGSSLIVSDKAMSGETGEYTDFVILTR